MKRKERPGDIWKFSLTLGIILAGIGGLRLWRGVGFTDPLITLGAASALLGFLAPRVMRPVYKGAMFVGDKISYVVTRVLLMAVYVLVFIPYGLIFRIARKDLLDRGINPNAPSYWNVREEKPYDPASTERMF